MIPIRDNVPARKFPFVTHILIIINVIVFLHEWNLPVRLREELIMLWGVTPIRLMHPALSVRYGMPPSSWTTIVSGMFLHGSWLHLVSNMWALWLFGDNVEDRLGHGRFAVFYMACGVAAFMLHILLNQFSGVPTIGASGAIAGVMGAYFLFFPLARMIVMVPIFFYPLFFEVPAALYLLVWIVTQISSGTFTLLAGMSGAGGVAFWAHVGGFFAGMALGGQLCYNPRGRGRCYWERDEYRPW